MDIAAANVAPNFANRRNLTASELQRVDDLCVVMEHHGLDSDYAPYWVYTIGGVLDGQILAGCRCGGDVIIISGVDKREDADGIAIAGLMDVVSALDLEAQKLRDGHAALERLDSIGAVERLEMGTASPANKSDAFERDMELIQPLKGEDILLSAGQVRPKEH